MLSAVETTVELVIFRAKFLKVPFSSIALLAVDLTILPEGVETVCERVEMILSKKEDILLDELAKKLSGEEKKNEFVILNTEFGEKSFRVCDIKNITVIDKNGKKTEIFSIIKEILEGK